MTAAPETADVQPVPHLTVEERTERGLTARAATPRSTQKILELPADRDPVAILEEQAKGRVAELVPIRYQRMLASPFAFYRGAAAIMAADLATTPSTGLRVQLVGDAHLANFGGYASPERNLVFDVNDFDETHPGPFEWDVKRLVTSIEIAGRAIGLSGTTRRTAVQGTARAYRDAMRQFAAMGNLEVWYSRADLSALAGGLKSPSARRDVEALAAHARAHAATHDLASLTEIVDGQLRIAAKPPLIVPIEDLIEGHPYREEHLRNIFRLYRRSLPRERRELLLGYRYQHLARKVVGVGSVGLRAWIMLLIGRDQNDPLFLQLKEAVPSVLEPYLGKGDHANQGQRVVEGQRLSQATSDIFLGWMSVEDENRVSRDYYVRQLRDWKISIDVERVVPKGLGTYAGWCAWSLARAHARSGDRVSIAAFLGKGESFDRAVADFAEIYADLNERDHAALAEAARAGRIQVAEAPAAD